MAGSKRVQEKGPRTPTDLHHIIHAKAAVHNDINVAVILLFKQACNHSSLEYGTLPEQTQTKPIKRSVNSGDYF